MGIALLSSMTASRALQQRRGICKTEADWKVERTVIKKGASIGSGTTILSNVTVGENSIVGAGSVVTKDVALQYDRGRKSREVLTFRLNTKTLNKTLEATK